LVGIGFGANSRAIVQSLQPPPGFDTAESKRRFEHR
jgi:hypothetical protein